MDSLTYHWYGMTIELALRSKSEQEYEDLFCDLMFAKHSDDFQYVKAAGQDGDGKADGYLVSDKHVFQSYAPSSGFRKSPLLTKISGDFLGAKKKWEERMAKWTFVHNSFEGLPKYGLDCIEDLKQAHSDVDILPPWGPQKIKEFSLQLSHKALISIFGIMPEQKDLNELTHESIRTLLRSIASREADREVVIAPVSVNKLSYNKLSDDAAALLAAGRRKEKLVEEILLHWPDPVYGEELANSFRNKYRILAEQNEAPDAIFGALKNFAGGDSGNVNQQVAALAVMSYFFERCDIFENAPEGWTP